MSKAGLISLLGLCSALLPFIGIPLGFKTALAVIFGVLIFALGFLIREERKWLLRRLSGDHHTEAYTENGLPVRDHTQTGVHAYGQTIDKAE